MKKIISLTLAASMVAGMSVSAIAAINEDLNIKITKGADDVEGAALYTGVAPRSYKVSGEKKFVTDGGTKLTDVTLGSKLRFKLDGAFVEANDEKKISQFKAWAEWDAGSQWANDPKIERIKYDTLERQFENADEKTQRYEVMTIMQNIGGKDVEKKVVVAYNPDLGSLGVDLSNSIVNNWSVNDKINAMSSLKYGENKKAADLLDGEFAILDAKDFTDDEIYGQIPFMAAMDADTLRTSCSYKNADDVVTSNVTTAIVADITAKAQEELRDSVVKTANSEKYDWFVTVSTKSNTTTSAQDLAGKIYVGKTLSAAKATDNFARVNVTLGQGSSEYGIDYINDTVAIYDEDRPVMDFATNLSVVDLEFDNEVLFIVDVTGQNRVNVEYDNGFNQKFADKYPTANLDFFAWSATPVFNRTGDLYIYAPKDKFIYEVADDNTAKAIEAVWDPAYQAFKIRTRRLGQYVVSDIELELGSTELPPVVPTPSDPTPEAPEAPLPEAPEAPTTETPVAKPNPPTGR